MKVIMLGWEFPPFFAGGVGIACYELTKELCKLKNININYIMPYGVHRNKLNENFEILSANSVKINETEIIQNLKIKNISTLLYAYDGEISYQEKLKEIEKINSKKTYFSREKSLNEIYGKSLIEEVFLYSKRVSKLLENESFDLIHAHDWTTFPAAILLGKKLKKPVIIHVHITEFDKTGGNGGNEEVFKIEKEGFLKANRIIAVSNFTKNRLVENYHINPNKIDVIHNGGISDVKSFQKEINNFKEKEKIVLFAGRLTLQKGPEYFIHAAKKVLEIDPEIKFIVAGKGDLMEELINLSKSLNIFDKILFKGFFTREDAKTLFSNADVFVMPSVSEPFGIIPLEAISKGTPVIISKQSGISEVLENSLKIDFWDVDEIANKILALLKYEVLHKHISKECFKESKKLTWENPAKKVYNLYSEVLEK